MIVVPRAGFEPATSGSPRDEPAQPLGPLRALRDPYESGALTRLSYLGTHESRRPRGVKRFFIGGAAGQVIT